jgi:hypothetical protein
MAYDLFNPDIDPNAIYYNIYSSTLSQPIVTTNITGDVTIITTINGGGGGQATGPSITFSGGTTGMNFTASGNTIALEGTLLIANGGTGATTSAGARSNLGAAASGVNSDITSFTALTGNTGVNPWTGTADGSGHATYSGTASAAYVPAELQDVMDKLQDVTEFLMFLVAALLAPGVVET